MQENSHLIKKTLSVQHRTDPSNATVNNTVNAQAHVVIQAGVIEGPITIRLDDSPDAVPVVRLISHIDESELFVGRPSETQELLARLSPEGDSTTAVVSTVVGMGGIGKTALTRYASRTAVARGWFTGGAIMVSLHGYAAEGRHVDATVVFSPLLSVLGVDSERIPRTGPEQAAAFHQRLDELARRGKRVLLVFDDVSSAEQVRDILPRSTVHRAVVTARDALTLPKAPTLNLDVQPEDEARAVLEQTLHQLSPGDTRIDQDSPDAMRVVQACGRLPLALEIAAAMLADDAALTWAELADELAQAVTLGGSIHHGELSVTPVFDLSWHRLQKRDPLAARVLTLLPLNPGPSASTGAAAALLGASVSTVRPRLRRLSQARLINHEDGHWRMHDLIHSHARTRMTTGTDNENDVAAAVSRLLDYYARTAADHAKHLPEDASQHEDETPGENARDTDRITALKWFADERANLLAAVPIAAADGHNHLTIDLAKSIFRGLDQEQHTLAQVAVAECAIRAAEQLSDNHTHAIVLHRLGALRATSGQHDEAVAAHRRAVKVRRITGDRDGEAHSLHLLGTSLLVGGWPTAAVTEVSAAEAIYRELGDREAEAGAHGTLARAYSNAGDYNTAWTTYWLAIGMHRDCGDTLGEAIELHNLGHTLLAAGRRAEAIDTYRKAAEVSRAAGHRRVKAHALDALATLTGSLGRGNETFAAFSESLETFRALGDTAGESTALANLAGIHNRFMHPRAAVAACERAIELCRTSGRPHSEALALSSLGAILGGNGQSIGAIDAHRKAVDIWRDLGDRESEGQELMSLARKQAEARQNTSARESGEEAVRALKDTGQREEAREMEKWIRNLPVQPDKELRTTPPDQLRRVPRVYTPRIGCLPFLAAMGAVVTHLLGGPVWLVAVLTALAALGWATCLTSVVALIVGAAVVWTEWGTWWIAAGATLILLGGRSLIVSNYQTEDGSIPKMIKGEKNPAADESRSSSNEDPRKRTG